MTDFDYTILDNGDEISTIMRRFYPLLLRKAFFDASRQPGIDIAFDLDMPEVQEILDELAHLVRGVAETTKDGIRALVSMAADQGWSPEELAAEIQDLGEQLSATRAMMIARTETAAAYSKGALLAYQRSGVVGGIEWLVFDPCPICEGLAGEIVPLGETFTGGITHPPAHPNCRCAIAPIVE